METLKFTLSEKSFSNHVEKNYFSCKNKIWMKISIYYEEMGIGYARAIKLDFWRGLAEFSKEIRSVILKCVR